ncbi:SDR family NAD(P)-dependent oxidoreductase [Chryseobacterium camelliae]|uniref:SDR family NAD(P)-dependent oxidoreductase n=1 Tax=Chryseobacterium camelliae TaxID=1265445 RepID=UPI002862AA88|nr:SDR family NAD(P)-dependent oxidoreductase [Chryseobacterium camelliae]MDR6515662.1 short-subunit dehydrogenase [Chryseobacterium camelliae]
MIVLGSTSEVAQAFVEKALQEGEKFEKIYLVTSNRETTERFARHIDVKFFQQSEVIELDLMKEIDYNRLDSVHSQLLFCAAGYLGEGSEEGLYDNRNTERIISINYSRLVPVINYFAHKFESRRSGTIIGLSSVAGDRGRQSNFIYGSAKAAFTAYLSGLRNYLFEKKVHVMTVKPGFMATKMTEGMPLNPALTATPKQAAAHIFKAYKSRRNITYVLPVWAVIMMIIRNIPEFLFKKLKL